MAIASKHFDPLAGIDIHMTVIPPLPTPLPIPTPQFGIVLDPFDYIPIIGSTVDVNGVKRGTAGTGGVCVHIPLGLWLPNVKMPAGVQFDGDEIFMGSKTVLADGDPFSRLAEPVLNCQFLGMLPPIRLKKKSIPMSMVLPTGINLTLPTNVIVGGPSTVNWMALAFRAGFAALGALRKTDFYKAKLDSFKKWRQGKFGGLPPGFLKCKVLRAEPVDIRDGSVAVSHHDFEIPGRIPLAWSREYNSREAGFSGCCGKGWETPADLRLQHHADGSVLFAGPQIRAWFQRLPQGAGIEHAELEFSDGARLYRDNDQLVIRTKDGVRYNFADRGPESEVPITSPILRIEDSCGNHWRFEYSNGHLMRIIESGVGELPGRFIEVHANDGRILQLRLHDPTTGLGHLLVGYRYGELGDLIAALDPLGAARTFEYHQHHLLRHTDRLGISFHYGYDKQWRVVHAWGDGGLYDYRFKYDALLHETEVTDSLGNTSLVKFDESGLPLCEIDPLDGMTVFEYDDSGRTTAVVDPVGLRTEWAYDERGNVLSLTQADGTQIQNTYDADDNLLSTVDPAGNVWSQQHDSRGLLQEQRDPIGAMSRFAWDDYGQLQTHTNARQAITTLSYDHHGNLSALTDPLGYVTQFEHDALGRLQRQTDPLGQTTLYRYDAKGRLLNILSPGAGRIGCEYDAEDQLIRYEDEAGAQTRFQYVGIGQIGKRIQPDGHTLQYDYDTEEQLIGLTNQRGERYELRRDALGRIVEEVDYWGQSRHYLYDAAGRLRSTVDPLGQRISFETDKLGRITRKCTSDARNPGKLVNETFQYDKLGQLVGMRNPCRRATRMFDAIGRMIEEVQDGFQVAFEYDAVGNRIGRRTSANHHIRYAYDLRDQVSEVAINDEAPIVLARDALGRTRHEQLSPQLQRSFDYDQRSLLTTQSVLRDASPLFETHYSYDKAGNLTQREDSQQGRDRYHYDVLGRLLEHTDPKGKIERFFNDPAGDRLQTRIKQVRMAQAVGGNGQSEILWTREGSFEGQYYVFDRAGDLIRKGGNDRPANDDLYLVWDANHRLVESRKEGKTTRYGYDCIGRRVFKNNEQNTTWFYWDGDALLGEVQQSNEDAEAAPLWVGNVADLIETRRRQDKLKALQARVREYVYYPGTFVPLALIDPTPTTNELEGQSRLSRPQRRAASLTTTVGARHQNQTAAEKTSSDGANPRQIATDKTVSRTELRIGVLGGMSLGALEKTEKEEGPTLPSRSASLNHTNLGNFILGKGTPLLPPPATSDATRLPDAQPSIRTIPLDGRDSGHFSSTSSSNEERSNPTTESTVADHLPNTEQQSPEPKITETKTRAVYHYHVDSNGCPTRITDKNGHVAWSASYAAWGAIPNEQSNFITNLIRFQGQQFDSETGLHYNRYRYYEPWLGQYATQDPIGLVGGINVFCYGLNPTGWIDPIGWASIGQLGTYGSLNGAGHIGDGLQAHELLRHELLVQMGLTDKASRMTGNPSIALDLDRHTRGPARDTRGIGGAHYHEAQLRARFGLGRNQFHANIKRELDITQGALRKAGISASQARRLRKMAEQFLKGCRQ